MIGHFSVQSEGQKRLRVYLVVFRWLSIFLGLIMTGFGAQKFLINPLNQFLADSTYILNLLLFIYHAIATFVILKFDDSKMNVGFLIVADAIAGGYMSFYYGMPYFFAAILLPTLVAAFYFDLLISMVVALISSIFYGSVIAVPLIRTLKNDPNSELRITQIIMMLETFLFSGIAIFMSFRTAQNQEEEVQYIIKKLSDEKNMLFESHQETKREFSAVFSELEKKQELMDEIGESFEKADEERKILKVKIEESKKEINDLGLKLRNAIAQHKSALEEIKSYSEGYEEYQERLKEQEDKILEINENLREREALLKEQNAAILVRDEVIEERDKIIKKMQEYVVTSKTESSDRVEDLEQKIGLLVGKINQLNSALQAREKLFSSYARVNENVDLDSIYTAIVNESIKLVPSQTAILFVEENSRNGAAYFAQAAATPYKNLFIDYSVLPGEGSVGWVAKKQKPIRIDNGELKSKKGEDLSTLLTYEKSALVVPILYGDETQGILYLGNPKPNSYSDKDTFLMNTYCKLVGPSINTSKAYEKATKTTLTESDSGLYNETYFLERLKDEVARSNRYEIPLTLSILEIENYKKFSQNSEKEVQKRIIKDLTEILVTNIRETDIVARLLDNKFAILFIQSQKQDAIMVCERIRMSAEMRSFRDIQSKRSGLHLSIGLANFPIDAENKDNLYKTAEKCLKDAHKKGGNQTMFVS